MWRKWGLEKVGTRRIDCVETFLCDKVLDFRQTNIMEELKNRSDALEYLKIAVTGGIGSGKSTVCKKIKELGYSVFSCDEIYASMLKDMEFSSALEILFPGSTNGGCVNKQALLCTVLRDKKALETLNAFTHPKIMARLFEMMDEAAVKGKSRCFSQKFEKNKNILVFAEVPLLFEGKYDRLFDKIIVVKRNETEKIRSVIERDGCKENVVKEKMALQFDYSLLPKKENYPSFDKISFLENNDSLEGLETKIKKIIQIF